MKLMGFIKEAEDEQLWRFTFDAHSLIMGKYFEDFWHENTLNYEKSGKNLIKTVNDLDPELVLDVGCGKNLFKKKIKNLVGIDPSTREADVRMDAYSFREQNRNKEFDVVLALESINFGPEDKIEKEFEILYDLTKKGGHQFWRLNMGSQYNDPMFPLTNFIEVYSWTEEKMLKLCDVHGLEVRSQSVELSVSGDKKMFFHLYKY
jgi:predicted TPR repeat methyltransferase